MGHPVYTHTQLETKTKDLEYKIRWNDHKKDQGAQF